MIDSFNEWKLSMTLGNDPLFTNEPIQLSSKRKHQTHRMPRIDLLLSNESSHRHEGTARLPSDGNLTKMLWDAGIARDLASSGRAGDHERNDVENRSNPREARSAWTVPRQLIPRSPPCQPLELPQQARLGRQHSAIFGWKATLLFPECQ